MTDICDPPSGDDDGSGERDAPAIASPPSIWRLLRALSLLPRRLVTPATEPRRVRPSSARLHRLTDYQLRDIGLGREPRLTVLKEDKEGHLEQSS
jgi:uncharacterized protein YjiS (DUF1127 family)